MADIVEVNNHQINATALRPALLEWGKEHFRAFPWRFTADPYRILIAEVMLHRTQARQVLPVYEQFVRRYPDVTALVQARREELHQVLYSLGLRWRIDLVFELGAVLYNRFDSMVPEAKEDLLSLPGISDYIASAVRCFAWNLPEGIVDTNTVRVTGRLFGLVIKDSSRRNRQFRQAIVGLVDPDNPRAYNYHLLDLAAQVCTPATPHCDVCPLMTWCITGQKRLAIPSTIE